MRAFLDVTRSVRRSFAGTDLRRVLAVVLAVAALASFSGAWWLTHRDHQRRTAVAAPVPASLSKAVPQRSATSATATSATATSATATPNPAIPDRPITPMHLFIPSIGVNTSVAAAPSRLAYDEFLGRNVETFGAPPNNDVYTTVWWSANARGDAAARPGDPGMAVILGHTQIGAYGVFNDLGQLRTNETAAVSDGHVTLTFAVINVRSGIPKSDAGALTRVLVAHPGAARLALITCSGHFNGRESAENTVAFLSLISGG